MKAYTTPNSKRCNPSSSLLFLFCVVICVYVSACAKPSVKTTTLVPARFDEPSKIREVAVLPFDGPGGEAFSREIEGALSSIMLQDKQYFTLVDRMKLDKTMTQMVLSQSGFVDTGTASKIGKLVGARGIYTGVVEANCTDSPFQEQRTRCASYKTSRGKKGNQIQECARYQNYNVSCTKRNASFTFIPKLAEVETGRVVYSNSNSGSAHASKCSDDNRPLPSRSDLISKAKQDAMTKFRNDIAPYYVQVEISLIDSKKDINSKEAIRKFEQGLEFAKANRLDRACELWREANTTSPNSMSILYSLGICAEISGDIVKAFDLYKKADRLLTSPNDTLTAALGRVSMKIQDRKKLKEQL